MFLQIQKPIGHGRRFVIPDIHGFPKTLKKLISKLSLSSNDQLFFLGDYLDRGPSSAGVLDVILDLQKSGYNVFCIRGNHEENFLKKFESEVLNTKKRKKTKVESWDLIDTHPKLRKQYFDFLNSLPFYIELDNFLLVHAGFDFSKNNPLNDYDSMLRIRFMEENPLEKTIIHGHNVTRMSIIKEKLKQKDKIIPLDNGLYYSIALKELQGSSNIPELDIGNLICLNLDSYEVISQENVD